MSKHMASKLKQVHWVADNTCNGRLYH